MTCDRSFDVLFRLEYRRVLLTRYLSTMPKAAIPPKAWIRGHGMECPSGHCNVSQCPLTQVRPQSILVYDTPTTPLSLYPDLKKVWPLMKRLLSTLQCLQSTRWHCLLWRPRLYWTRHAKIIFALSSTPRVGWWCWGWVFCPPPLETPAYRRHNRPSGRFVSSQIPLDPQKVFLLDLASAMPRCDGAENLSWFDRQVQ